MKFSKLFLSAITVAGLAMMPAASCGQTTWIGGNGTSWQNAANWDTGMVPDQLDSIAIIGAPNPTTVDGNLNIALLMVNADGILQVSPSRVFDFSGMELVSLTNLGTITLGNNTDFQFQGQVNNAGDIEVLSTGSLTDIEVDGDTMVTGGGTITLGSNSNSRLMGLGGVLSLGDQTVQGFGQIGSNSIAMEFSANALIDANSPGNTMTIDGNPSQGTTGFGTVNHGTMRASNGGVLRLENDVVDNTGGTIEALADSTIILLNGSDITGGLMQSTGTGQIMTSTSVNVFLAEMTLDADLRTSNNADLGITGTINNAGVISLNSKGSLTDLEVQAGGATLTGGGTTTLDGNFARIMGLDAFFLLGDQTVQGFGQVGANELAMEISPDALIDANSPGNTITVDGNPSHGSTGFGTVNNGTMRASNGGTLRLQNDVVDNTNGTIEALADSTVNLQNSTEITGGIIQTSGSGQVTVATSVNVFLNDLTLDADVQASNNCDLGISGTINNTGSISLNSTGSLTDMEVQADGATLTGGGTTTLDGNFARIMGLDAFFLLGDQTVQGFGQVGANELAMEISSDALIDANSSGNTITVDGNPSHGSTGFGTVNNGTMRASNGGTLRLQNDVVDNTNGTIEALADSTVNLQNSTEITGGIIQTSGSGQVTVATSVNVFLNDLTLDADVQASNNCDLGLSGVINNLGTISMNSTGSTTDLEVQAAGLTLNGPGTVILSGTFARINGFAPLMADGGTYMGTGSVNVDSTFNGATIAPGLSVGRFRFVNSDTLFTGDTVVRHEIQSTVDNPGVSADVVDVDGKLDFNNVTVQLETLDANGDPGELVDFDPDGSHKFVIAIADEFGITNGVVVDTTAFANNFTGVFSKTISPRGNREAFVIRYGEFALADVNRDGSVNLLDVAPFVAALASGEFSEEADVNCDGAVNLLDVDAFINALSG